MKTLTTISIAALLVVMGTALAPDVRADASNQLTRMTFSSAVEVPGHVLPAGTYWFRVINPEMGSDVVQITNDAQNKVFATLLAIPEYRAQATGDTVITFEERVKDSPKAIKAWFYPGNNRGEEFVYTGGQLAR